MAHGLAVGTVDEHALLSPSFISKPPDLRLLEAGCCSPLFITTNCRLRLLHWKACAALRPHDVQKLDLDFGRLNHHLGDW